MFEMKFPHLFEPLQLGKTTLRNRIIAAPTGSIEFPGGKFGAEVASFYEQKARGGAAIVHVSEAYVNRDASDQRDESVFLDNDFVLNNIGTVADGISKHGAIPSLELMHCGMFASGSYRHGSTLYAPSETVIQGTKAGAELCGIVAKEMPEEIIYKIIDDYAESAARAKMAGYKMVLVHAGHGWLLQQFFSPVFNHRTDKWGGDVEGRARFAVEVCDAIKRRCGKDFLIDLRMSADDLDPNGYKLDYGVEIAKQLDGHCDIIHVSVGQHELVSAFVVMHPSMFLEDGCNRHYAAEIKKHVKTPVATVGAFSDPYLMEEVLASGGADLIASARGILADPDLPLKARCGKEQDINQCLRCYTCFSNIILTHHFSCAINPTVGREEENKYDTPPVHKRKVLVAGGGIAGMQAALTAADRGHEVILCEKKDHLGGALVCERDVAFKPKLDLYLENQARKCQEHPGIEVRLSTPATKELATEIEPDAIIAALGARPVVPTFIKGYEMAVGAEEVYYDIDKAGDNVVLIGGGLVGCELGIHLAQNGRKVTILEMLPKLSFGLNMVHGEAVEEQIKLHGINVCLSAKVLEIVEGGVVAEYEGETRTFEADTVIYSVGQRPLTDEINELRFCAPEFAVVGDGNAPANIYRATTEGYYAARDIGRI